MKTIVVTGAYGVIGRAICEMLVEKDYSLIIIGRDEAKIKEFANYLNTLSIESIIKAYAVDLSNEHEIRKFCESLDAKIDVLINNAGTTPQERIETPDGIETQWAVNVMGYVWMMHYLNSKIREGGRIVNVASFYAGSLDLTDVEFVKRPYDNDTAYRQSKQANRMLSAFYAELLREKRISVNSCHPGEISSKLSNNLGFFFPDPPRKGADTPVWLATDPNLEGVSGKYFEYRKETACNFSKSDEQNKNLYDLCKKYIRLD